MQEVQDGERTSELHLLEDAACGAQSHIRSDRNARASVHLLQDGQIRTEVDVGVPRKLSFKGYIKFVFGMYVSKLEIRFN
jgi:hypothetical protein